MPHPRVLPGVEVRAACNRRGCPKGVCGLAETLFILAISNWALVISSSILRFSFFTRSSSGRDSIEDAGGGRLLEDFPAVFAASRLDSCPLNLRKAPQHEPPAKR